MDARNDMSEQYCQNCKYAEPSNIGLLCMGQKGMPHTSPYGSCDSWKSAKQTNFDTIQEMSIEELAEFFAQQGYKQPVLWDDWLPLCNYAMGAKICHENGCKSCWLNWLKQEVQDGKD